MNNTRNILLIVEGEKTEVKLFNQIIKSFPEIDLSPSNIIVYKTNLWVLNANLTREFGAEWYSSNEIDFRSYLQSEFPTIKGKKITDIFLVFDFERQDWRFDGKILENMCLFFNDSVENGQLYVNYPMVESYKHLNVFPLPDKGYKYRLCKVSEISFYKELVGTETKYGDIRRLSRDFFQQATIQNIKKISYVLEQKYELTKAEVLEFCEKVDLVEIARKQSEYADETDGFIHVLCTCLLFISNYNKNLLYEE